jgi:hypothetical protein
MDDQTVEIAKAKGNAKIRGPFKVTCGACGERYWPDDKEEHLASDCFPPKIHVTDKMPAPPPGGSAGERWRLMKINSITPAERKSLGLPPRQRRKREGKN